MNNRIVDRMTFSFADRSPAETLRRSARILVIFSIGIRQKKSGKGRAKRERNELITPSRLARVDYER
jgi:hypothetical protein